MYSTSSQARNWIFDSQEDIDASREDANQRFVEENIGHGDEDDEDDDTAGGRRRLDFLDVKDERQLVQHYEFVLKEFCGKFSPSMPRYVVGTTMAYMKRFYVENSTMDYHPRDVMLTSLYLACKVEEFNVSIAQFVGNLKGDRNKAADLVLSYELMVMEKLHFHLAVHNPYRPLEGFLIDLKTRLPRLSILSDPQQQQRQNPFYAEPQQPQHHVPEALRRGADAFVDKSLNSDAMLLFPPAHIALAGLAHAAADIKADLDPYFALLADDSEDRLLMLKSSVARIRSLVKKAGNLNRANVKRIEERLEKCRNQSKNPASDDWKRKIQETEEEETTKTFKRRKTLEPKRDSASEGIKPLPP